MTDRPAIVLDVTLNSMKANLRHWVESNLSAEQVNAAIDRAFAKFDIYVEIERQATEAIAESIRQSSWGIAYPIQQAIREAAEKRVQELIEPIVQKVTRDITKENQ